MSKYQVIINDDVIKEYPYKIQAYTYCILNGYVTTGYDEWNGFKRLVFLDDKVKILKG